MQANLICDVQISNDKNSISYKRFGGHKCVYLQSFAGPMCNCGGLMVTWEYLLDRQQPVMAV